MVEFGQSFSVAVHLPSLIFNQSIREKEKIYSGKAFPLPNLVLKRTELSMLSRQHILY